MDLESARKANLLVGNHEGAPVLEILFAGARLELLRAAELALTGADVDSGCPRWRSFSADSGFRITLGSLRAGVWSYLAVRGGFVASRWFKSASVDRRAGFGEVARTGSLLHGEDLPRSSGISSRFIPALLRERFDEVPVISVWRGPEWGQFPAAVRARFLEEAWRVSRQSDRAGYRLEGPELELSGFRMLSAPLAVGTVQVPGNGLPIVVLRDGPTVGGYPRLCLLDPSAISRFTQCAPETCVRFRLVGRWT